MKTTRMALTIALLGAAAATAAALPPDPATLLKRSDRSRNGWDSFVGRVKIIEYESGKVDEEHLFEVSQKGVDKSYVEFLSPREKGRHMLMLGDDMWIYLPDTSRPIRITPAERLAGNASNGDVARTNYAEDYDATYVRTEDVAGVECHVLDLAARRKGATYRRILYWVKSADAEPVKAEYFLASGKLIKSATFDAYQLLYGVRILKRITIQDEIRKGSRTVIEYLGFWPKALPDKLFHQGRTERF
jgi:outer membrane lipoprotein-sorting protein